MFNPYLKVLEKENGLALHLKLYNSLTFSEKWKWTQISNFFEKLELTLHGDGFKWLQQFLNTREKVDFFVSEREQFDRGPESIYENLGPKIVKLWSGDIKALFWHISSHWI